MRIARTSGLTRYLLAENMGVGLSILNEWVAAERGTDDVSAEHRALARVSQRHDVTRQQI